MSSKIKGKISIIFDENINKQDISFMFENEKNKYETMLTINKNTKLSDILKLDSKLQTKLEEEIAINLSLIDQIPDTKYIIDILNLFLTKKLTIMSTIDEVKFLDELDYSYILEFLKNNPELKNKNITLGNIYNLTDTDKIKEVATIFKDYPNIRIILEGNTNGISISDSLKTINIIDSIVTKVKKYNLSPIEQIMYVYDLIRERVYHEEDKEESYTLSRDLSQVLLGDKIVCAGYANIFDKILKKLDIKTKICNLNDINENNDGHSRNAVYISDSKYHIKGIYFFDLTWDSKKDNNDYLLSYRYFAKLKRYFDIIDTHNNLINKTFPLPSNKSILDFTLIYHEKGFKKVPPAYVKTINNISTLVDNETKLPHLSEIPVIREKYTEDPNLDLEEVDNYLFRYALLLNNPIDINQMVEALYNVRKIEYYENPTKFPFTYDMFYQIAINSNWPVLKYKPKTLKEYHAKIKKEIIKNNQELSLDKNINTIKLIKTLRNIYNKKKY